MRKTIDDSRNRKRRMIWLACSMLGLLLGACIYKYTTLQSTPKTFVQGNPKAIPTIANQPNDPKKINSNTTEITAPVTKDEKENNKQTANGSSNQPASIVPDKVTTEHTIASIAPKKKSSVKAESVSGNTNYVASIKNTKQLSAGTNKANTVKSSKVAQLDKIPSAGSETSMNTAKAYVPAKDASSANETTSGQVDNSSIAASSISTNKKPENLAKQATNETSSNTIAEYPI